MFRQYFEARPLQAGKLLAILAILVFSIGAIIGLVPGVEITSLFLVPVLSIALAILIIAETVLAGYRSLRTDRSVTDWVADKPVYATIRAVEVLAVGLSGGAFVYVIDSIPNGPMSGPGAIGLFFIVLGIAAVILGASLLRSLSEFYYYRQTTRA